MSSCATQKKLTFWGGWKNSLIFLNNLSVDHMGQAINVKPSKKALTLSPLVLENECWQMVELHQAHFRNLALYFSLRLLKVAALNSHKAICHK